MDQKYYNYRRSVNNRCTCGKLITNHAIKCRECESKTNPHHWKGGVKIDRGRVLIYSPNHPFRTKQGYVYEHRLVMEEHLGRYLTPKEIVHHIDFNKKNNRLDNLYLFSSDKEHRKYHNTIRRAIREELNLIKTKKDYNHKYKYSHNNKCSCGKLITNIAPRCMRCAIKHWRSLKENNGEVIKWTQTQKHI